MCDNKKAKPYKKCAASMNGIDKLYINKDGEIIGGKHKDGTEFEIN